MKKIELQVSDRKEIGKNLASLRDKGLIPAVVYGNGFAPLSVSVSEKDFLKAIGGSAGSNAIINLAFGSEVYPVLAHEIQKDSFVEKILHVDFLKVRMDQALKARVHIVLVGVAPGVKDDGGILIHHLKEIEIKCLPDKIPEKIEVDVSSLKLGQSVSVADIKGYDGVEFLTPSNEQVAHVEAPAKEEEVQPVEAAVPVEGQPAAADAASGAPAAAQPDAGKPQKEAKK